MAFLTYVIAENKPQYYIHMILDGAAYHRVKLVKQHAELLKIALHSLPP